MYEDDDTHMLVMVPTVIMVFLRITGIIDWSWWVVTSLLILYAICAILAIIIVIIGETK